MINGCWGFLFFFAILKLFTIDFFKSYNLSNKDNCRCTKNGIIIESLLAYSIIVFGIGLIFHYETWWSLDIGIFKYSLTNVASPLTQRALFNFDSLVENFYFLYVTSLLSVNSWVVLIPSLILLKSISTRLESKKLTKLQLKQLFNMYKSWSEPCMSLVIVWS